MKQNIFDESKEIDYIPMTTWIGMHVPRNKKYFMEKC
jgi:hypothetical protein